jgi:hypothetical protein
MVDVSFRKAGANAAKVEKEIGILSYFYYVVVWIAPYDPSKGWDLHPTF